MKHLLVGLICIGLGVWGIIVWWNVFGMVMRGVIPFTLITFGIVATLSGLRRTTHQGGDNRVEEDEDDDEGFEEES